MDTCVCEYALCILCVIVHVYVYGYIKHAYMYMFYVCNVHVYMYRHACLHMCISLCISMRVYICVECVCIHVCVQRCGVCYVYLGVGEGPSAIHGSESYPPILSYALLFCFLEPFVFLTFLTVLFSDPQIRDLFSLL